MLSYTYPGVHVRRFGPECAVPGRSEVAVPCEYGAADASDGENAKASVEMVTQTHKHARIREDTRGYARIREDTRGYARIRASRSI